MDTMPGGGARPTRLIARDFRNHTELDLPIGRRFVALVGENGAGKTNLLEALSLFSPGRGLRRADLSGMARIGGPGGFAISLTLGEREDGHRLGTGCEPPGFDGRASRLCRIDGAGVGSPVAFAEFLRVVWLTPDLDGLFRGPAGDRRRFLDRLVLAVDATHGGRVSAMERALRSRNRLLEERPDDGRWLDAIEREVAELGVAVALARRETVERLDRLIGESRDDNQPFPWAAIRLEGELDDLVAVWPALEAEDRYRSALRQGRHRDRAAGRSLIGAQSSDLVVRHGPKDVPAATASTGEQKALLIGLVLAHARLVQAMSGLAPVILLDEVAAHLDPRRRAGLYDALDALSGQVWMTGADPALFAELGERADIVKVVDGRIVSPETA
ncbi:DNA replication/repair protein RecF [Methylobacterium gnaphalii]|uniref:DNA replication and repair protein RecF n=1 Tax=Methylobacterium gnaphalii TaxID=1010610 RepID=A0A512JKN9_9HYPH|nr:DNA replication/repair protein RecF [Methylobacterium gnaphalii]GEP10527.1 DNA replication and repair protein RecF [Methylobacterium gnaphalii]GJD69245.1 DNA replication and repair protein RecF [Methylobacterium gnaphalii]GLS47909.1 DNA replication and repair protein RecF [Methylobacterium gnaphalii]